MSELTDLYREVILDHSRRPRNFGVPAGTNHSLEGYNPLCGDRFTVHLAVDGDTVRDAGFQGSGCAISTASASTMTEAVKGKSRADVEALFVRFHDLVMGKGGEPDLDALGKLAAFSGVAEFPMRVKCATLAWHTMRGALEGHAESVSTESTAE
ncbi:MAG TPA: SUF system NifU family Fe-S cluster assembly protein [Myxococcota bacterium]|jgi:nitrogen fixation NifU-like protein|nr:SUF system NifU family Fe-S cluster assembly protein [Myxococcota bacterium]